MKKYNIKRYNKLNSAFSLLELASVVTIAGLLITAIVAGSKLIKVAENRINSTSNPTSNPSEITQEFISQNSLSSLEHWYETTQEASFNGALPSAGDRPSTWYDISSNSKNVNLNANISYEEDVANNVAGLFANAGGSGQFNINSIQGGAFTIFLVEKPSSSEPTSDAVMLYTNYSQCDDYNNSDVGMRFLYKSTGKVQFKFGRCSTSGFTIESTSGYDSSSPRIWTFGLNSSNQLFLKLNGNLEGGPLNNTHGYLRTGISNIRGYYNGSFSKRAGGTLFEVLIYSDPLSDEEINNIEKYLTSKYLESSSNEFEQYL